VELLEVHKDKDKVKVLLVDNKDSQDSKE